MFTKYKKENHIAGKYSCCFDQMWQTSSKTAGKMLTGKLSVEKVDFQCFVLLLGYFPFLLPGLSSLLVNHLIILMNLREWYLLLITHEYNCQAVRDIF